MTQFDIDKKTGLKYRPDLGELHVIREQSQYQKLDFEGRTVMDVGANIGSFVHLAGTQGAKMIWAYEPMPPTFDLLAANVSKMANDTCNFECNKVALTGGQKPRVNFYLSKTYPSCHTTVPVRGREQISVDARNFWDTLHQNRPQILKVDIEGGEYDFMFEEKLPPYVEQLAIELHMKNKAQQELAKKLTLQFEEWHSHRKFRFNWHVTTLVLHRHKESELGRVREWISSL